MSFFALLPSPPKHPKIRILKKWEKIAGDIIILHQSTKNHMMYSSWDTEWERQKKLSFWAIFCHFIPLTTKKIKIKKKWKKKKWKKHLWDVIILHMCTKNYNHMTGLYLGFESNFHFFSALFWALRTKSWSKATRHFVWWVAFAFGVQWGEVCRIQAL